MRWQGLLFGQVVCLCNTASGVFTSLVVKCGINAPLYLLVWQYTGLIFLFGTLFSRAVYQKTVPVTLTRAAKVSLACIPDSQGLFLILLSYSYTSLISVSVLLQSSFVMVAVMSRVINGKRYGRPQIGGLSLCGLGIVLLVVGDLWDDHWQMDGSVLGDMLALLGTFLYSV